MAYWNETDPTKPIGVLDVDAELDVPVTITQWLQTGMGGAAYASHTVAFEAPLESKAVSAHADGVITFRVGVNSAQYDAAQHLGKKFGVTISLVADDGQKDDRTWRFQLRQR